MAQGDVPKRTKAYLLRLDGQNHTDLQRLVPNPPACEVCKSCPIVQIQNAIKAAT